MIKQLIIYTDQNVGGVMFCKHDYKEVARTYAQTMEEQGIAEFNRADCEDKKILMHGLTTILYVCEKCNKHKKVEMFGKEDK